MELTLRTNRTTPRARAQKTKKENGALSWDECVLKDVHPYTLFARSRSEG